LGNYFTGVVVGREPSFSVELAERDPENPLSLAKRAQRISGEVEAFSNPHAGSAKKKQAVGQEAHFFAEFVIQKAVVLGRKGFRKILIEGRKIVSDDKSVLERFVCPRSEIIEQTAKAKQIARPSSTSIALFMQAAQPAKDMRVAPQLGRLEDFGMAGVQIAEKIVYG